MEQHELINYSVEDIQVIKNQSLAYPRIKRELTEEEKQIRKEDQEFYKKLNYQKKLKRYGIEPEKASLKHLFLLGKYINEDMRKSLLALQKDFQERRNIYINLIKKGTYSDEDPVDFFKWYYWVKDAAKKYGFVQPSGYIEYNKDCYALRSKNLVWLVDDFKLRDKQGKFTLKWKLSLVNQHNRAAFNINDLTVEDPTRAHGEEDHQLTGKELINNYCLLFRYILKGLKIYSHDFFFWNVMKMVYDQIEVNEYMVSPKDVYACCYKFMSDDKETVVHPKKYKNTARKQELYLQPGYEEQGKINYNIYKREQEKQQIFTILHDAEIRGKVPTLDEVWREACYLKVFLKKHKNGNLYERYFPKKSYIAELIKEVQNDDRYPKHEVSCKVKRKVYKEQDTSVRKSQERSLWHSLVNLEEKSGINFSKIKEVYPEVNENQYKTYRSRLKKKLNENKE